MSQIKIKLNKRSSHKTAKGEYPLVLNIGHKSKAREIPFGLYLLENQFDEITGKITGIQNAVRHTKRINKLASDVDYWVVENQAEINLWSIDKLKDQIERKFFNKQIELTLLTHGAKYLQRLIAEERYSTASSYEDALKAFTKYQMKLGKKDDRVLIPTLFLRSKESFEIKEEFKAFDIPIKSIDSEMIKNFKAYLNYRFNSKNSVGIVLRSLQAIINDASESYEDLRDHRPLARIKKTSYRNAPNPLTTDEINKIRELEVVKDSSEFHVKNFFLFMFGNMGMNFLDMALIRRLQFDGERIKYFRNKTRSQGDFFSIKQNEECLTILNYYLGNQQPEDFIFPILPNGIPKSRIHRIKNDKLGWFNKHIRNLAKRAGIEKDVTSYSPRDTWTNIGLGMGIDIRKISAGLGHSSIEVTNRHYGASIQEKILDEINELITA